jgi:hypothetical protein
VDLELIGRLELFLAQLAVSALWTFRLDVIIEIKEGVVFLNFVLWVVSLLNRAAMTLHNHFREVSGFNLVRELL